MSLHDEYPYELGALIRTGSGKTALIKITSLHVAAVGYHGQRCMGSTSFCGHSNAQPAGLEDYKTWFETEKWRKP